MSFLLDAGGVYAVATLIYHAIGDNQVGFLSKKSFNNPNFSFLLKAKLMFAQIFF